MTVQISHEAEYHRQHARYRIPGKLLFGGKSYSLVDWSVSGFSVNDFEYSIELHETQHGELEFTFAGFRFCVEVEFEKLRTTQAGVTACRFVNLSTENLSVFHQIINAFLAGEVIQVGEMLSVISREGMVSKDFSERLKPSRTLIQNIAFQCKRLTGFLLFSSIIVGLLSFVFTTAYERIFVIHSTSAYVTAQTKIVRAPDNGFYQASLSPEERVTKRGDLMGIIKMIAGGASGIESPCDCTIIDNYVDEGLFVGKGESVYRMIPTQSALRVDAQIRFDDVRKIRTGQKARVLLTTGDELTAVVSKVLSNQLTDTGAPSGMPGNEIASSARARVILELDQALPVSLMDSVAYVTIDTIFGQ